MRRKDIKLGFIKQLGLLQGSVLAALILGAMVYPVSAAPNVATVKPFKVALSEQFSLQRRFVGQVVAKQRADIGFELAGKVSMIFVDEGEQVEQGEVLMQLDTELLDIEFLDLQAQMQQLAADEALVDANLKRIKSLKNSGYASEQSLDELTAQRKSLQANRARIQSSIQANRTRVEKSTLLAPYDGIVEQRNVAEGTVVGASQPVLQVLQRDGYEIKVGIPVRLATGLPLGQMLDLTIADQSYGVKVLTKGGQVDPITRTLQLRLRFSEPDASLFSGQVAYLHLPETVEQAGFWLPIAAITDGIRGLWNVYTLQADSESDHYRLQRRDVTVLYANAEHAFVQGALENGEYIVATGVQRVVPGQLVTPNPAINLP